MPQLMIFFTILLTIGAYLLSKALYLRYRHPLLNIVLLGAGIWRLGKPTAPSALTATQGEHHAA